MILSHRLSALTSMLLFCVWAGAMTAQDTFALTSPAIASGGNIPSDLKCRCDGEDRLSRPLAWTAVPEGAQSLAVIMHH